MPANSEEGKIFPLKGNCRDCFTEPFSKQLIRVQSDNIKLTQHVNKLC